MLRAWGNKVILRALRPDELSDTYGGGEILVPGSYRDNQAYRRWTIFDVGPKCTQLELQPGDEVICDNLAGNIVRYGKSEFQTVFEHQIIAII